MKTVNYCVVAKINPADRESGEKKYYAVVQSKGQTGIDEIAERISASTTATRADVLAVLAALEEQVIDNLESGQTVKLGDIGSFRLSVGGEGSATEDTYDTSLIERVKVVFTPSSRMKAGLNSLKYTKVPIKNPKETDEEGGLGA